MTASNLNVDAKGRAWIAYGYWKTRERAEAALEACFASGEIVEAELYGDWTARHGNGWTIQLRAN